MSEEHQANDRRPVNPADSDAEPSVGDAGENTIADPVVIYTADGNMQAHSMVTWLESHGVKSFAVEDNSGTGLFAFGTVSQIHKPQVFVSKSDLSVAGDLIEEFESQRSSRVSGSRRVDHDCVAV